MNCTRCGREIADGDGKIYVTMLSDLYCLQCCRATLREGFERGLAEYYTVRLVVGYHPLVVLPPEVATAAWREGGDPVHLDYGLDMPVPIDDMRVTDLGVSATLSFARSPFHTFVPWESVVTMGGGGGRRPAERPKLGLVP